MLGIYCAVAVAHAVVFLKWRGEGEGVFFFNRSTTFFYIEREGVP